MIAREMAEAPALLLLLQQEHAVEHRLCDTLEEIADGLPAEVNTGLAAKAVTVLRQSLRRHIALQERYLLPLLITRAEPQDNTKAVRAQIAAEHVADEVLAHDVADELEQMIRDGRARNPEMLGYMLHGYFECRRRHLAWEVNVILPLATRRLTPSDWRTFSVDEFEARYAAGEFSPSRPPKGG